MSNDPTEPTPPTADPAATPPPPKKARWGRRLLIAGAVVLLLIVGLVALLPTLLSTGPGTSVALNIANGQIPGRLTADDLSLGWFSGIAAKDLKLYDEQNAEILDVHAVTTGLTLLDVIGGKYDLGATTADANLTNLVVTDGYTNYQRALGIPPTDPNDTTPIPRVTGKLDAKLTGTVTADGNPPLHLEPATVVADFSDGLTGPITNDITAALRVADQSAGSVAAKGELSGVIAEGDAAQGLTVDQSVDLSKLNLAALSPLLSAAGVEVTAAGVLDGTAKVLLAPNQTPTVDGRIELTGGDFSGPALSGGRVVTNAVLALAPGKAGDVEGQGPATATVSITFDGLKLTAPEGGAPIPVQNAAINLSAWGNPDGKSLSFVRAAATAGDSAGNPVVDLLLTASGVDQATQSVEKFTLSKLNVNDVPWLVDRLRPLGYVPPTVQVPGGKVLMTAAGSANGKTQKIVLSEPLKVTTPGLQVVSDGRTILGANDKLQVLLGGAIEAAGNALNVNVTDLNVEAPGLSVNKGKEPIKLAVGGTEAAPTYAGSGELLVSSDLPKLLAVAAPPDPKAAPGPTVTSGTFDARVNFAGGTDGVTAKVAGQAKNLSVSVPDGQGLSNQTVDVNLDAKATGPKLAAVSANGTIKAAFADVQLDTLALRTDAPADDALGGLQKVKATIKVPDLPAAYNVYAALVPPAPPAEGEKASGPPIQAGSATIVVDLDADRAKAARPAKGQQANAGGADALSLLKGSARVIVPNLSASGVDVANLDLPISINDGVAATQKHGPATLNGGELTLSGLVLDLTTPAPRLSLATKDRLRAVVGAKLNPILSDQIGKFVGPQFANATQATGLIDVTVLSAENVALGEPLFTKDSGSARIALSVRQLELENKLWTDSFGAIASAVPNLGDQGKRLTMLKGNIKDATITLADGRVRQDLTFSVVDPATMGQKGVEPKTYPLSFAGGVGLADLQMNDFTMSFPRGLLEQWLSGDAENVVQKFFPDTVAVPLVGSSTSPKPQVQSIVGDLVNRQKDQLIGRGQRELEKKLGGKLPVDLGDLGNLGGKSDGGDKADDSGAKEKPEEVIGDVLGGFLKPKKDKK